MTNLPIASNNTPPSAQQSTPASIRSDSDNAASASQTSSMTDDQLAKSFSAMLARQIDVANFSTPDTVAIDSNTATGGTIGTTMKKSKNSAILDPNALSDPANSLAALLLHIPVQSSKKIESTNPNIAATGTNEITQQMEDNLQRTSGKSLKSNNELITSDDMQPKNPISNIPFAADTAKHQVLTDPVVNQVATKSDPIISKILPPNISSTAAANMMLNIQPGVNAAGISQTITAPLGNNEWANEFSQKIVWMSTQQNQTAELHLNPPDLGPVNVVLKFSDNQISAQFTSPHGAIRDAVENALPKLREMLADNNIMLGNATVSDQPPRDRSAEGFMNQGSGSTPQRETPYNINGSDELLTTNIQNEPVRRHNGMLDTFA